MANRNFPSQRLFSFHMLPVDVDCRITISGATGAIASISGKGVASAARLGTGQYRVTLQDPYASLNMVSATMSAPASGTPSNILSVQNIGNSVGTAGGGTIDIATVDNTAALAAPSDGSVINLLIRLNNSSVQ